MKRKFQKKKLTFKLIILRTAIYLQYGESIELVAFERAYL